MTNHRAMKKMFCIIAIYLHLTASCSSSTPIKSFPALKAIPVNLLDLEEEYRIYNAIIESSYADRSTLIILNQTYFYMLDTRSLEYLKENYPSLDEFLGSYLKGGNQQYQLEDYFDPTGTEVILVDSDYIDWIFAAKDFDQACKLSMKLILNHMDFLNSRG